jgi:hypothetical protein
MKRGVGLVLFYLLNTGRPIHINRPTTWIRPYWRKR